MTRVIAMALVGLAGCYDPPQPACGFSCGAEGACPDGYTCVAARCVASEGASCPEDELPEPADTHAPRVVATAPADGALDVPLEAAIEITFDEDVRNFTIASIRVRHGDDRATGTVEAIDGSGRAYRFVPDALFADAAYRVLIDPTVEDFAGNHLAATAWTFSTVTDRVGPRLTGSVPADGATDVPIDQVLFVGFDEPVTVAPSTLWLEEAATGTPVATQLTAEASGSVTIEHPPLARGTRYRIVVTAGVTDLRGNPATPATVELATAP